VERLRAGAGARVLVGVHVIDRSEVGVVHLREVAVVHLREAVLRVTDAEAVIHLNRQRELHHTGLDEIVLRVGDIHQSPSRELDIHPSLLRELDE
jgi:hypothetical protein